MADTMRKRLEQCAGDALLAYDMAKDSPSRAVVRAILRAMLEPSEGMLEAANREWDGRMSARSAGVWQAMIQYILDEIDG